MLNKLRNFLFPDRNKDQREILKKLIPYYKHCLGKLTEEDYRRQGSNYQIDIGICCCAYRIFKKTIYIEEWVKKHEKDNSCYWFDLPDLTNNFTEYKDLVQKRIDLMEKILKEL